MPDPARLFVLWRCTPCRQALYKPRLKGNQPCLAAFCRITASRASVPASAAASRASAASAPPSRQACSQMRRADFALHGSAACRSHARSGGGKASNSRIGSPCRRRTFPARRFRRPITRPRRSDAGASSCEARVPVSNLRMQRAFPACPVSVAIDTLYRNNHRSLKDASHIPAESAPPRYRRNTDVIPTLIFRPNRTAPARPIGPPNSDPHAPSRPARPPRLRPHPRR